MNEESKRKLERQGDALWYLAGHLTAHLDDDRVRGRERELATRLHAFLHAVTKGRQACEDAADLLFPERRCGRCGGRLERTEHTGVAASGVTYDCPACPDDDDDEPCPDCGKFEGSHSGCMPF